MMPNQIETAVSFLLQASRDSSSMHAAPYAMAVPMKLPVVVALVIILSAGNARICTNARVLSETPAPGEATTNETSVANLPPADLLKDLNSTDLAALTGKDHPNITDLAALYDGAGQPNVTELSALYGGNVSDLAALAGAGHLNMTDLSALVAGLPNNTDSVPTSMASSPGAADFSSVVGALANITLPDLSMDNMDLPEFSFPPMTAPEEIIPMSNFTFFGQQVSLPSFLNMSSIFDEDNP